MLGLHFVLKIRIYILHHIFYILHVHAVIKLRPKYSRLLSLTVIYQYKADCSSNSIEINDFVNCSLRYKYTNLQLFLKILQTHFELLL